MSHSSHNEYSKLLSPEFYKNCPKTVLAAIAVSYQLTLNEENFENVQKDILKEWEILHENGIVLQKPPKKI